MLIALLLALSAPGGGTLQQRDLRCGAALTSVTSSVPEAERGGVAAGAMFFIGRIEGRDPGVNLTEALIGVVGDEKSFMSALPSELKRCPAEMQVKGESLKSMGDALKRRSAP